MSEPLRARRGESEEPRPDPALYEQVPGAVPPKASVPVRHLTDDEISYFIAHDPGTFFDEDFHRFLEFDRAIDREMEAE